MIRKYHNHKLQTNLLHYEEESHNNHETPARQTKQANKLSLPFEMIANYNGHKVKYNKTYSHKGSNNKQWINNDRAATLERTAV